MSRQTRAPSRQLKYNRGQPPWATSERPSTLEKARREAFWITNTSNIHQRRQYSPSGASAVGKMSTFRILRAEATALQVKQILFCFCICNILFIFLVFLPSLLSCMTADRSQQNGRRHFSLGLSEKHQRFSALAFPKRVEAVPREMLHMLHIQVVSRKRDAWTVQLFPPPNPITF